MLRHMKTYTMAGNVQDRSVDIWGEPCTIFRASEPITMQGYENDYHFEQRLSKVAIDFQVKRRWFYHFNWFPENEDRLSMGYFHLSEDIAVDDFIRTKTIEHVSPYGDLMFRIVKIGDMGKFFSLKRVAFLYAIDDQNMYRLLEVK